MDSVEEPNAGKEQSAEQERVNKRRLLTSEQRSIELGHFIDPGFVNHRKVQTVLGRELMAVVDRAINQLSDQPEWQRKVRIDHIYTEAVLLFCSDLRIRPLQDVLASLSGHLFCSTEELLPCPDVYSAERATSTWRNPGAYRYDVEFQYSTRHIASDTLRGRLSEGAPISIVAQFASRTNDRIVFEPLVMGFPWLRDNGQHPNFEIMWHGYDFFEHFIEDFDEFSKVADLPPSGSPEPMREVSEAAFKQCLSELLGDAADKDWGGEQADYYSAHLHLRGRRVTASFVLKGPASFRPMGLNHLGKNNDQIVRLSHSPAQVLFVQHSHDITSPVRETLRAFAVQPSRPRRYCLVDGRDSLRLLLAYGLYEKALALSKGSIGKS